MFEAIMDKGVEDKHEKITDVLKDVMFEVSE